MIFIRQWKNIIARAKKEKQVHIMADISDWDMDTETIIDKEGEK